MKATLMLLFLAASAILYSQDKYSLWEEGKMPYYKENPVEEYEQELWGTRCVLNITKPELTVYPAKGANSGYCVIVCPGGGYSLEALYHEGYDVAEVLSENGITAAVLKYRLPLEGSSDTPELLPITDLQRALEMMRGMSDKYGFDPGQTGVMGFSAGAHLSAHACSKEVQRPDFALLIYGCPRLTKENKAWLESELFHRKMTDQEAKEFDLVGQINSSNPPAFLIHSVDDETCNYRESTHYAKALREHSVPNDLHLFQTGGHGYGLGRKQDGTDQWIYLAINWIRRQ